MSPLPAPLLAAMQAAGVAPADPGEIAPDGRLHRFHVEGDKPGARNGWAVLHPDDPPAAAFGSWRNGAAHKWCARSERELSPAQREAVKARIAAARRARDADRKREHQRAAERAARLWNSAHPAGADHPYLIAKGITPGRARQIGDALVLPVVSPDGTLSTLQFIAPDGSKRLLRGGRKAGCCIPVAGRVTTGPGAACIILCEGWATGATLAQAEPGALVIAAVDAGNLLSVTESARKRWPNAPLVIAADNDPTGRKHGHAAAAASGALLAVADGADGADFNDMAAARGIDAVRAALAGAKGVEPDWARELEALDGLEPVQGDGRPCILIRGGALPALVDAAEAALLALPDQGGLFQRGGQIVRVARLEAKRDGVVRRAAGAPIILHVEAPGLREGFTRAARWQRFDVRKHSLVDMDCPLPVASTYAARAGEWRLRPLLAVLDAPIMREDGSLLVRPGYDERTGFLLMGGPFPTIPERPSRADAMAALDRLKQPFKGFPFVDGAARSVALAAVLTGIVRPSLPSSPLFGWDAPTAGTGKGLAADVVAIITTGRIADAITYKGDPTEDAKHIFALLVEGAGVICLDNISAPVEGDALCSILTQGSYRGRILGSTKTQIVPTAALLMASGNNLTFVGDMTRRALVCRMDAEIEHPETREFQGDLRATVLSERMELVCAALTVLRAYHVAGRPRQPLEPYGSFERWSDLVRAALVWLGEADPCATRKRIQEGDETKAQHEELLSAWLETFSSTPETIAGARNRITPDGSGRVRNERLRDALLAVAADRTGRLNERRLAWYFRHVRERVRGGMRLKNAGTFGSRALWRVELVE